MKSYQLIDFGKPLRNVDIATPVPSGDEVVIAVRAAGSATATSTSGRAVVSAVASD